MILKIQKDKYYGHQGRTKELFKKKYRSLGLKWMVEVKLGDDVDNVVDGWISGDLKQYLLKLPEEGEYKRFTGNSIEMINFLKLHGAVEVDGEERGVHVDYDNDKGFVNQKDGHFIGADLVNHYRVEKILKDMPANWGVRWCEENMKYCEENMIIGKKKVVVKKRVIRRIK